MSREIEETVCPVFQRLNKLNEHKFFPKGHLVALNGNEFVFVLPYTFDFQTIYKYNVANNQWTPVMSLEKDCIISGTVFEQNTKTLYLSVHHVDEQKDICKQDLQSLDTERWAVRKSLALSKKGENTKDHIVLFGDEIHSLYIDDDEIWHHFVVHKVSGDVIQEPLEIHPKLHTVYKVSFVASRSSIVVVCGRWSRVGGPMIVEYSLTTKQWTVWKWARVVKKYYNSHGGWVVAMDGRYILSIGGRCDGHTTDLIMIYDVERERCVESELKLPMKLDFFQVVLMADQNRDELLTFGFVRGCYKAKEFRNMKLLPVPLIAHIGKCCAMEFIHLFKPRPNLGFHYRVNVDEVRDVTAKAMIQMHHTFVENDCVEIFLFRTRVHYNFMAYKAHRIIMNTL